MIFYRATDDDGLVHWVTVQAEAKALDKNFEQVDVGTDKAALKTMLNDYELQLYVARQNTGCSEPVAVAPSEEAVPASPPVALPTPDVGAPPQPDFVEDEDRFDASVLESQVEAFGMLGEKGLAYFDGWSSICGISAGFARGVALLNVLAADDHQLARVFLRDRIKKRREARV